MSDTVLTSRIQFTGLLSQNGYFSDVYEGLDPVKGKVAIKVCKPVTGEPAHAFQARQLQLLSEGRHLETATHANVVQVHQVLDVHQVTPVNANGQAYLDFQASPDAMILDRKSVV